MSEDIRKTNECFEQYLGYRPRAFAYPYGAYNQINDEILKTAGYTVAFTSENKIGRQNDSLYLFPRVEVYEQTSLGCLLLKYSLINLFR
ncbi:MAG: polysaccharide deacetylase family protein [Negativicutes bacterium]|nr:polysaccharide deacetylase family protein [Negativicutes bacterium]